VLQSVVCVVVLLRHPDIPPGMARTLSSRRADGWYARHCPAGADALEYEVALAREFRAAGVETVPQALRHTALKFGDKACLATRQLLRRHRNTTPDGKVFEKLELGDYAWITYKQVQQTVSNVGKAIRDMGYKFSDRVAIFAETRAEWLMSAIGCLQERVSICTVYPSLSDAGVIHALNETEVPLVFTSYDLFPRMLDMLSSCPLIKTIVVMEDQLNEVDISKLPEGIKMIPFKTLVRSGEQSTSDVDPVQDPEDTAIIMYTSGSTGTPKGVEITHTNIISFIYAGTGQIPVHESSRYMAFLPLAHILELVVQISIFTCGAQIFYSSPTTLTSSSPKVAEGTEGDAKLARPTRMTCVPLVLDKVIKNVVQKVEQGGRLKSFVFKNLVYYKSWVDYVPVVSSVIDHVIFKKVKAELGGCLKEVICGGAPMSAQTQSNFEAMFGCKLLVGYGLTETAACVSCMDEDVDGLGHTGAPNFGVLLKLIDWEDGGYRSTDKPNPRGEIVVGGKCVTKGYFKRPEETAQSYYIDNGVRAFKTGDIGEIDQHGCLKIIDRKKDLIKLKHGEYVSLGNIESTMKAHPLVETACVFADSLRESTVMVVVPSPHALLALTKTEETVSSTNASHNDMSHLYTDQEVIKSVLSRLQTYGKKCGLGKWETPAALHLTQDTWDPESGLVTAALKLRRRQITERYSTVIADLYRQLD